MKLTMGDYTIEQKGECRVIIERGKRGQKDYLIGDFRVEKNNLTARELTLLLDFYIGAGKI